jgi:hypothetical protein
LSNKGRQFSSGQMTSGNVDFQETEEFGLIRIREILAEFHNVGSDHRCDCAIPCKRKFLSLQSWRSDSKNENKDGFAYFQV